MRHAIITMFIAFTMAAHAEGYMSHVPARLIDGDPMCQVNLPLDLEQRVARFSLDPSMLIEADLNRAINACRHRQWMLRGFYVRQQDTDDIVFERRVLIKQERNGDKISSTYASVLYLVHLAANHGCRIKDLSPGDAITLNTRYQAYRGGEWMVTELFDAKCLPSH